MHLIEFFHSALTLTGIVLVMMLLIEYLNVISKGNWLKGLTKTAIGQVIFGALLGIIPGCMGTFFTVSLFTHGSISFGALVSCLIATSGDETFLMFSLIPKEALFITIVLFVVAIIFGLLSNYIFKNVKFKKENHLIVHSHNCENVNSSTILNNLKNISFQRAALIFALILVIINLISGGEHGHEHSENDSHIQVEGIINYIFAGISFLTLIAITKVSEHFISEHLWGHVIKKHFLKVFFWTFSAIIIIELALPYLNVESWIKENPFIILIIASLVGLIPESGPHMIFVTLFAAGSIPLGVLIASSIVQDGHGALPLLAESQKSFLLAKFINLLVGIAVGSLFLVLQNQI